MLLHFVQVVYNLSRFHTGSYKSHLDFGDIGLDVAGVFKVEQVFSACLSSSGVKTEKIRKRRILAGLRDVWRVFLEILPLQNSKDKRGKT